MLTALSTFGGVSVNNLQAAKEFYVDTLDFKVLDDSTGLRVQLPGGYELFLYEKADHQPASFTVLNFVVENIDDTIDHMAGHHGIPFERYEGLEAEQDERGVLRGKRAGQGPDIAWFKDPAGNILALIEN